MPVSDIGFGTSGLMGAGVTDKERISKLDLVYELGVMHYDTAPLYGMGEAEKVLGKFAQNKRDKITIGTKYGLFPVNLSWPQRKVVPFVRYLYHKNSHIKAQLKAILSYKNKKTNSSNDRNVSNHNQVDLSFNAIEMSLDASLKKLNTDYIDFMFLHDCSAEDVDESVIESLNLLVKKGKVRQVGLASSYEACNTIAKKNEDMNWVYQFENNILSSGRNELLLNYPGHTLTHGALRDVLPIISRVMLNTGSVRRLTNALQDEFLDSDLLSRYLLAYARETNKNGTVIFSSTQTSNIQKNIIALRDSSISKERINKFYNLVISETEGNNTS